jgi:hypothetical protein
MATGTAQEKSDGAKRSPLPWILLALWFVWLGAMIFMSWPELWRGRPAHPENREAPAEKR